MDYSIRRWSLICGYGRVITVSLIILLPAKIAAGINCTGLSCEPIGMFCKLDGGYLTSNMLYDHKPILYPPQSSDSLRISCNYFQ